MRVPMMLESTRQQTIVAFQLKDDGLTVQKLLTLKQEINWLVSNGCLYLYILMFLVLCISFVQLEVEYCCRI